MYQSFHENGYRFFGLRGVTDGVCNCGNVDCTALFKHPWFSGWQYTPEWSDEQIEVMIEGGQLDHGFGVKLDDLLVIDVDARNGGVESYGKLARRVPEIMQCGFIVETGSGGGSKHLYFKAPEGVSLLQHLEDYPGIDFKSGGGSYVVGPGSKHISGRFYEAVVGDPSDIGQAPQGLIALLERPEYFRADFEGKSVDITEADIREMLCHIPNNDLDYETYINVGMAIHHATGGAGIDIWDDWAKTSSKYKSRHYTDHKWHSMGKSPNPITVGTLYHYAKQGGWTPGVTFDAGSLFADYPDSEDTEGEIEVSGIDLLRPPGFVGEIAKWLNSTSFKLREHLAVATALTAVGNAAGLRYREGVTGMRLNLFTFCVAGSGTGKEAMLSGFNELHVAAQINKACHGNFKSEQELISNIIHHQAAFYAVDEIGTVLSKVENARKKGGAAYLDGLVGQLMSIFSKSNGRFLLTGDKAREVENNLLKEAAMLQKRIDENDNVAFNQGKLDSVKRQLESLDKGIMEPFLSMIGFTTPETFNGLVTPDFVKNGFMSRALFFQEPETNPKPLPLKKSPPLPEWIKNTLLSLSTGGHADVHVNRVEATGEPIDIDSTADALALLERIKMQFWELGEVYKQSNGFEAIATRGFELTSKVSAVLAAATKLRTIEHVKWAYALVKKDLDRKAMLAYVNEETDGKDKQENGRKLMARILNRITTEHGETLAVLANKLKGAKREDVEKALDAMLEQGLVVKKETQNKQMTTVKWYAVD